jgi:hypothetical protein
MLRIIINERQLRFLNRNSYNLKQKKLLQETKNVEIFYTSMKYDPNSKYQNVFFNNTSMDGEISDDTQSIILRKKGGGDKFTFNKNQVKRASSGGYYVSIKDFKSASEGKPLMNNEKPLEISKEEMSSLIKKVLSNVFSENWKKPDDYYSSGLRDIYTIGEKTGNKDDTWSIMNYFDTKTEIHDMILDKYTKENNGGSLEEWMTNMFRTDKDFIKKLVDRQWQSIKNGVETENKLVKILKDKFPNAKIETFLPGSKMDRFEGVDLIINGITLQVKPLKNIENIKNTFVVSTYGMRDYRTKSKLEYIAYVSGSGEIVLFPNKQYFLIDRNTVKHYSEPIDIESLI